MNVDEDGDVGLERCDRSEKSQQWSYGVSGNLVSRVKGLCLQEDAEGEAVARKCGVELDSQVVALPGGVKLVD